VCTAAGGSSWRGIDCTRHSGDGGTPQHHGSHCAAQRGKQALARSGGWCVAESAAGQATRRLHPRALAVPGTALHCRLGRSAAVWSGGTGKGQRQAHIGQHIAQRAGTFTRATAGSAGRCSGRVPVRGNDLNRACASWSPGYYSPQSLGGSAEFVRRRSLAVTALLQHLRSDAANGDSQYYSGCPRGACLAGLLGPRAGFALRLQRADRCSAAGVYIAQHRRTPTLAVIGVFHCIPIPGQRARFCWRPVCLLQRGGM
jgi:hypothetical protein